MNVPGSPYVEELVWPPYAELSAGSHLEFFSTETLPTPVRKKGVSICPSSECGCNHEHPKEPSFSSLPSYYLSHRRVRTRLKRDRRKICEDRRLDERRESAMNLRGEESSDRAAIFREAKRLENGGSEVDRA